MDELKKTIVTKAVEEATKTVVGAGLTKGVPKVVAWLRALIRVPQTEPAQTLFAKGEDLRGRWVSRWTEGNQARSEIITIKVVNGHEVEGTVSSD